MSSRCVWTAQSAVEPMVADESVRSGYRDPDNYWRMCGCPAAQADRTDSAILAELKTRATEFEQIDSENASERR